MNIENQSWQRLRRYMRRSFTLPSWVTLAVPVILLILLSWVFIVVYQHYAL